MAVVRDVGLGLGEQCGAVVRDVGLGLGGQWLWLGMWG